MTNIGVSYAYCLWCLCCSDSRQCADMASMVSDCAIKKHSEYHVVWLNSFFTDRPKWETCTIYWCIASKLSPAKFLWNEQNVFVGGFISFQSALTLVVLRWQKSLPDIGGITIEDVSPLAPMEPDVHKMSNELILQISCNIFLALKWILMMRSGHNISQSYDS